MRDAQERYRQLLFASRITRHASRLVSAVALFTLSACVTTSPTLDVAVRSPSDLQDWQASGRIAVAGASTGGSGSFTWMQHGAQAQVQIHGPIGIGSLKLTLSDQSIRVQTSDGQLFEADDAQTELAARLGAQVPVKDLRFWMVGMAAPGEHQWSNTVDAATLLQQDWRIDYQRYGVTSGVRLPMKLVAASGPAKVRIVIDKWKLK